MVVKLNQITLKNVNLFLSADKFSEKFAGYAISSFIDLFLAIIKLSLIRNLGT